MHQPGKIPTTSEGGLSGHLAWQNKDVRGQCCNEGFPINKGQLDTLWWA